MTLDCLTHRRGKSFVQNLCFKTVCPDRQKHFNVSILMLLRRISLGIGLLASASICLTALFAGPIGLGIKSEFYFWEAFGIERFTLFRFGLIIFSCTLVASCFILNPNSYVTELFKRGERFFNSFNISISFYSVLLCFTSITIFLLFTDQKTAYEFPSTQDFPLLLRLLDDSYLENDFFTNSGIDSPRIIHVYFLYLVTQLAGGAWYPTLYAIKLIYTFSVPPLLFLVMYRLVTLWLPIGYHHAQNEITKLCLYILTGGGLLVLFPYDLFVWGWVPVQGIPMFMPYTFSFWVGLLYLLTYFSENKNCKSIAAPILVVGSFLHPLMGIYSLLIAAIFSIPLASVKSNLKRLSVHFFVGVLIPIVCIKIYFPTTTPIDDELFVDLYTKLFHWMHYSIPSFFTGKEYEQFLLLFSTLVLAIFLKKSKYLVLSVLIFTLFAASYLIHYIGTEYLKLPIIAQLGLTRTSTLFSILWSTLVVILMNALCKQKFTTSIAHKNVFTISKNFIFGLAGISLLFAISVFKLSLQEPLDFYNEKPELSGSRGSTKEVINWISQHTDDQAVFFVRRMDPMLIRVYGKRAVFGGVAYAFNVNDSIEMKKRKMIFEESHQFGETEYYCLSKHYNLGYLVDAANGLDNLKHHKPVYIDKNWKIYSFADFKSKSDCTLFAGLHYALR